MEDADFLDHDCMLAVREGAIERLGELFERHHKPLYGFFVKITGDRTASEDLVQQVFYRILKYRHTYRDLGKFTTWMYHLARKVAADHYRKSRSASVDSEVSENIHEIADHSPHAADEAAQQDDVALLRRAINSLEREDRELITLHRFQRLSHEELAGLHRCSVGAMKVRVHRALGQLRNHFFRLQKRGDAA